jgi:hypothetical protein
MKTYPRRIGRLAARIFTLFLFVAFATLAGPPLICHPFDIGSATSLPWESHGWNLSGEETYDTSKLASDTFRILASDPTVLVHMETLRRATLYGRKNPAAAKKLFDALTAATKSPQSGAPAALSYFDIGYLAESYKQWFGQDEPNPARGIDGYALVKQALQLRGDDPQMEFAAALITLVGPAQQHAQHVHKVMAGAKSDPLLARNLSSHFIGEQGQTVSEVLAKPSSPREVKP